MERDPVCGMLIEKKDAAGMAEHNGRTYYFHTPECNAAFQQNPEKYVGKETEPRGPEREGSGHERIPPRTSESPAPCPPAVRLKLLQDRKHR